MSIFGTDGDDLLEGLPGADDTIAGGAGDDTLRGGDGDDLLEGGAGADEIAGGEDGGLRFRIGTLRGAIWGDTAAYLQSDAGVTIDLAAGTAQGGHAEGDTLTGIESIRASDHADTLVARAEGSTLWGQKGDDAVTGGAGIDLLWGGKGDDVLTGGAGDDALEGGFGADMIDGGPGEGDYAGYELSDAGVTVDLAAGTAQGGHAEGDTLTGIERIWGSQFDDSLTGDDGPNRLLGMEGDDTLDGGAGDDELWGHDGADMLYGGAGDDQLLGHDGADMLYGGDGDDMLDGGAGDDMLDGGAGNDTFVFGGGDTVADFQDGSDLINISRDFGHITADNFETNVTIRQSGDDVEVQIGDAVMTLNGISAADLTLDDFI